MLHYHPKLGRLGNLLANELSFNVFINFACLVASALWSRAWLSNWAATISFKSAEREEADVTALDASLSGMGEVFEKMEASVTPSGVVVFEDADGGDGCDEDGLEAAAAA